MRTRATNLRTPVRCLLSVGALCAMSMLAAVPASAATITYQVDVDTSFIAGRRGFMELQFLSAGSNAFESVAEFSLLPSDAILASTTTRVVGDALGSLQGGVTIGNGLGMNELIQGLTFGRTLSFLLTLTVDPFSAAAAPPPVGSSFTMSLSRNPDFYSPFLSGDPTDQGRLVAFDIGAGGLTTWEAFGPLDVREVPDAPQVPEPATLLLIGSGVLGLVARSRRRRA